MSYINIHVGVPGHVGSRVPRANSRLSGDWVVKLCDLVIVCHRTVTARNVDLAIDD